VLVVVKKDHTSQSYNVKLATDLRKLNAVTEMDSGAIGDMSEITDKFNGKPYASCCDVSSGYYSFLVHPDDREKLCFVLPMSMGGTTFCWNRAPYGVSRLPAQFSRAIMTILDGMHEDVSSYIDDLTVHGHLRQASDCIRTNAEKINNGSHHFKRQQVSNITPKVGVIGI